MGKAKEVRIEPISAADSRRIIVTLHYSGKTCPGSSIHLGAFYRGRCCGAMTFGVPIDKRGSVKLVEGTKWNGMLELNRMAFSDVLPRNSESRALGYAMRWLARSYRELEWVQSFADATQCGDGTIYRAAGFLLTRVQRNRSILRMKDGTIVTKKSLDDHHGPCGRSLSVVYRERGMIEPLPGFQIRYIKPLRPGVAERLTVPVLPYSAIEEAGAGMYLGKSRGGSIAADAPPDHGGEGGSSPTPPLHHPKRRKRPHAT